MLFSEANQEWRAVPQWVGFLLGLGHRWRSGATAQRRIALVSMPCDSAAAGLIALGALIRDLGDPNANNVDGHYDALLRYARQYLQSCRNCDLPVCRPDAKRCGHLTEATGLLRSQRFPHKTFRISERTDFNRRKVAWEFQGGRSRGVIQWPSPAYAMNWYVDGETPPQADSNQCGLDEKTYLEVGDSLGTGGAQVIPQNLRTSFSGLCLAGRIAGEASSREVCASIRLHCKNAEHDLPSLLTVHGWSPFTSVSRLTFFNARTGRIDRHACTPATVVADGSESFLRILGRPEFQQSDVIGVIHRTIEREKLEAVGNRLAGLRQWYAEDSETLGEAPVAPRGISVVSLRKRTG